MMNQPPFNPSGSPNPQYPYGPQYPPYPPMPMPVPKKKPLWPWILALVLTALVASCCALVALVPGQHSTTIMQPATSWTVTHTFRGDGIKKTEAFTVGDDWKLQWKCNSDTANVGGYNVIVTVYTDTNTIQDIAVNTICNPGNLSGETEEHQGGNIYLDVNSEASWTLTVQEPA